MAEHEHVWVLTILEVSEEALEKAGSSSMIPITPAAICECDERLLPTEVERRLIATDKLSAEDATSSAELIASEFDYQWKWDGPDKYGPSVWKPRHDALRAYAAAREASDGR